MVSGPVPAGSSLPWRGAPHLEGPELFCHSVWQPPCVALRGGVQLEAAFLSLCKQVTRSVCRASARCPEQGQACPGPPVLGGTTQRGTGPRLTPWCSALQDAERREAATPPAAQVSGGPEQRGGGAGAPGSGGPCGRGGAAPHQRRGPVIGGGPGPGSCSCPLGAVVPPGCWGASDPDAFLSRSFQLFPCPGRHVPRPPGR